MNITEEILSSITKHTNHLTDSSSSMLQETVMCLVIIFRNMQCFSEQNVALNVIEDDEGRIQIGKDQLAQNSIVDYASVGNDRNMLDILGKYIWNFYATSILQGTIVYKHSVYCWE
jgi:hypothetical protein